MGRCDAQRSTVRIGSATRRPSHTPYCQASGEECGRHTIFLSLSQPLSVPLSTTYLFFRFRYSADWNPYLRAVSEEVRRACADTLGQTCSGRSFADWIVMCVTGLRL